jgi:hypothetical protein
VTAARRSAVIDVGGAALDALGKPISPKVTTATQPVRSERFTAEQVADQQVLSDQLTRINQLALDASAAARANPLGAPQIYRGIACGTGGAKVLIRHGLNRRALWWVVGWSGGGTSITHELVSDELDASAGLEVLTDANTIALRSYAVGTVDLAVA